MPQFSKAELAKAFVAFEAEVAAAARTHDWDGWVAHDPDDVDSIEHAMGTMKGRDQVRDWIYRTMTTFPGSDMTAFPSIPQKQPPAGIAFLSSRTSSLPLSFFRCS